MLRNLCKQAQESPNGSFLLNKEDAIYFPFLKKHFPKLTYFFPYPDLIILGSLSTKDFRLNGLGKKRFAHVLRENSVNRLKNIPSETPIVVGKKSLHDFLKKHYPTKKIILINTRIFYLNDDLLREIFLYLPPIDLLLLERNSDIKEIITPSFWREKMKTDFRLDFDLIPEARRRVYLKVFNERMTLPEAIAYGKTFPKVDPFLSVMALLFGSLLGGHIEKVRKITCEKIFTSLLLSFKLHIRADDKEIIRFIKSKIRTRTRTNIQALLKQFCEKYKIWYFTPEIIKRVGKYFSPITIIGQILEDLGEYCSSDPFLYLVDLYPGQTPLDDLIECFDFWSWPFGEGKKFLRPLIEKVGNYYLAKVAYQIIERGEGFLDEEIIEHAAEHFHTESNNFPIRTSEVFQKDNKNFIIVEGTVRNKEHKFGGGNVSILDEGDNEYNIEIRHIESQIFTIDDQARVFEIEKYRRKPDT